MCAPINCGVFFLLCETQSCTSSIVGLVIGLILFGFEIAKSGVALMGVGALLVVVSIAGLYTSSVWKWNKSKQGTYKLARAKQQQASDIWGKIDPLFRHIGKDVFFATSYAGLELQVLRDGTIEVHEAKNGGDDEENPMLSMIQSMAKVAGGGGDDDE